jgi:hypothetical protein
VRTIPFLPGPLPLEGPARIDRLRPVSGGCAIMWLASGGIALLSAGDETVLDATPLLLPDFDVPVWN